MLTKAMRKYVESETKAGYSKHHQYVNNGRVREDAIQALRDLALIARKFPDEQLAQIFGGEDMSRLLLELISRMRVYKT